MRPVPETTRILFLFSDTGGGHRSAAEAIIEALRVEYGDTISTEMVDVLLEYAPPPLDHLPELYPRLVRLPRAWEVSYRLSDGERRVHFLSSSAWPYIRRSLRRLVAQHPSDLIVSVHPLAITPLMRLLGKPRPPVITMVTDLVTTHAAWYHPAVDLCLVPTSQAFDRGIAAGLHPDQLRIVGLPVARRFCQPVEDRQALRQKFGLSPVRPVILLVGGGEGMGPIERIAQDISRGCPSATLVVIAGRNRELKDRLEGFSWPIPTVLFGFTNEMPELMHLSDILVTKAGPGTISEALNTNLPMILYSRLPGQEDGNVDYVVKGKAGVWAPRSEDIVAVIQDWLAHPEIYRQAKTACQLMARPQAARDAALLIGEYLIQKEKVKQ